MDESLASQAPSRDAVGIVYLNFESPEQLDGLCETLTYSPDLAPFWLKSVTAKADLWSAPPGFTWDRLSDGTAKLDLKPEDKAKLVAVKASKLAKLGQGPNSL